MRTDLPTFALAAIAVVLAACGEQRPAAPPAPHPATSAAAAPEALRFGGIGDHRRRVSTTSSEAQAWFDQGLALISGFNHDEARRSFQRAADLDPGCAMAWWGVAISNGPHINFPLVTPPQAAAARAALTHALSPTARANEVERELIDALDHRYADPQPDDRRPLDLAYADAMRVAWSRHGDDADIGALFAEALMDLRPWDLWSGDGEPRPETPEILATLEAVLRLDPRHPLANHLYIHAVEAGPSPTRGTAAADTLRDLCPGLGHLVHMPSHIDVRTGRWADAIAANARAVGVDRAYRERVPAQDFYRVYMAHDRHMLAFAAMMCGRSRLAVENIRAMVAEIPVAWLHANAMVADGFVAMPYEVLIRFGRWDEMLAEPEPAEWLPLSRALYRAARGTAFAAKGAVDEARSEQAAFVAARAAVPREATFGNNTADDVLAIAAAMLDGEILVRAGGREAGVAALRAAVAREDALRYDEPPPWLIMVRHSLGATLMADGRFGEAERVYRDDLARWPGNGWSLYGLAASLEAQEKPDEAAPFHLRFAAVWKDADVPITSSCCCQPGR